jgi:hypothetical protein
MSLGFCGEKGRWRVREYEKLIDDADEKGGMISTQGPINTGNLLTSGQLSLPLASRARPVPSANTFFACAKAVDALTNEQIDTSVRRRLQKASAKKPHSQDPDSHSRDQISKKDGTATTLTTPFLPNLIFDREVDVACILTRLTGGHFGSN